MHQWFELKEEDGRKIKGKQGTTSKLHAKINYVRGESQVVVNEQHTFVPGLYTQVCVCHTHTYVCVCVFVCVLVM